MKGKPPFRDTGLPPQPERGASDAAARREESPESLPSAPECPFCDGSQTEIMNAFGSHASVSTYWCRSCRSPFEMMRWRR